MAKVTNAAEVWVHVRQKTCIYVV